MSRVPLADAVPLPAPLVVQIFPIYACNFKCHYCHFAVPPSQRHFVTIRTEMLPMTLSKVVFGMKEFPVKPRVFRFVGIGEPLLHKAIVPMITTAVLHEVAEDVEVLTNGVFLTKPMSYDLAMHGQPKMVVSIQGVTKEKYKQVCGVEIDPQRIADNLAVYRNKYGGRVHTKIIDLALDNNDDYRKFEEMFGPVSDTIAVENAGPIYPSVPANPDMPLGEVTQYGKPSSRPKICPQPFATLQVNPDGNVVPCYSAEYPVILGNANYQTLPEIWSGVEMHKFRCRSLNGRTDVCDRCRIIDHRMHPEDNLDGAAERLKEVFGCY